MAWWRYLNSYHWFVFILAAFGWLFDTMDQQIFIASRSITMADLLPEADRVVQTKYGGYATTIFILGWATGGLIFGMLGDKWGRAKTMAVTIFVYAAFTGLSGLAKTWETFAFFRFLTGLGVGGEFAVGAALVAEAMPQQARAQALGMLQALSAVGNIIGASMLGLIVPHWGWQGLYYIGALPALLAVFVFWRLKEPEKWAQARLATKSTALGAAPAPRLGRFSDLFTIPRWRRNALVGLSLAVAGVLGLWGVGFWSPELIDSAIPTMPTPVKVRLQQALNDPNPAAQVAALSSLSTEEQQAYLRLLNRVQNPRETLSESQAFSVAPSEEKRAELQALLAKTVTQDEQTRMKSRALVLQQVGAFFGMYCFSLFAARFGRRLSFLIALLLGWFSIILTFLTFHHPYQIWYLWPILGFGCLAPFGGYAIYFPELFPTRLRTTGVGFCYNTGRYIAALGPFVLGGLAASLHGRFETPGFRVAAVIVSCSYLIGIVALIWAPETVNQPLPEDDEAVPATK